MLNARCAAFALLAACSEEKTISVEISLGQEEGVLDDVETVRVRVISATGEGTAEENTISEVVTAPGASFDLGDLTTEDIVYFEVFGETAAGDEVVRGRSVTVPIGSVSSNVIPLFAQRLDGFSRPPGELVRAHVHAPAAVIDERFLVAFGGDSAATENGSVDPALGDFYDLLSLSGGESGGQLPRAARSLIARSSVVVLIDDEGATAVDRNDQASELTPPDDFAFSEVAGGRAIDASNGTTYVVGCTRPDIATDAVLTMSDTGSLAVVRLSVARAGCGATFVDGLGLVLFGGSDEGKALEVIELGSSETRALPYDTQSTTGAALVVTGEEIVLAIGGLKDGAPATPQYFDLRCSGDMCDEEPDTFAAATIAELAARGEAFQLTDGILVVGEDTEGETLAFRVAFPDGPVTPLAFRDRRFGATAVPAPNGTLAVLGGLRPSGKPAVTVEMFFPAD